MFDRYCQLTMQKSWANANSQFQAALASVDSRAQDHTALFDANTLMQTSEKGGSEQYLFHDVTNLM